MSFSVKFNQRLDYLFSQSGFSPQETETLFTLLYSPAQVWEIFNSGKFSSLSEVKLGIKNLLNKGLLIEQKSSGKSIYKLAEPEIFINYLDIKKNKISSNLLDKWKKLCEIFSSESMYGVSMNPAIRVEVAERLGNLYSNRFEILNKYYPKIEIKVIDRCNLNCIYCCDGRKSEHLTFNKCLSELEKAKSVGIKNIIISGGEPTLWKKTPHIIKAAKKLDFDSIELFTNGLLFYFDDLIGNYVKNGLTSISLHISAVEKEIYEKLVGRKNVFEIIEKALAKIAQFKDLYITIFTIINKFNINHLNRVTKYFLEYKEKSKLNNFFHFLIFCCTFSTAWQNRKIILPKISDSATAVKQILNAGSNNSHIFYVGIPFCLMKGYEVFNYDLYCVPAQFLLKAKKVDYLYQDLIYTKAKDCYKCIHNDYCMGIQRGYTMAYGLNEFVPVNNY